MESASVYFPRSATFSLVAPHMGGTRQPGQMVLQLLDNAASGCVNSELQPLCLGREVWELQSCSSKTNMVNCSCSCPCITSMRIRSLTLPVHTNIFFPNILGFWRPTLSVIVLLYYHSKHYTRQRQPQLQIPGICPSFTCYG